MTFYLAVVGDNSTSKEICNLATPSHGYKLVDLVASNSGRVNIKGAHNERLDAIVVTQNIPDPVAQALINTAMKMGSALVLGYENITPSTRQLVHQASPWSVHVPCAAPDFLDLCSKWLPVTIAQARSDLIKSVDIQTVTAIQQVAPESMTQLLNVAEQACGYLIQPRATWTQDAKACQKAEESHTVTVTSHTGSTQTISITTSLRGHAKGLLAIARQMPNDPKRSFPLSYKFTL